MHPPNAVRFHWLDCDVQVVEQQTCLLEMQLMQAKNKKNSIKHGTVTRVVALLLLLDILALSCLMRRLQKGHLRTAAMLYVFTLMTYAWSSDWHH